MRWGTAAADTSVASTIDATLNRLRMRGDALADAVALRLDVPPTVSALSELRFLAKSEIGLYQALLDQAHTIPTDTDFAQIERGRQIQLAFSPVRDLAWLCGALPQGLGQCPLLHPAQFFPEVQQRLQLHRHINRCLIQPDCLHPGGVLHEQLLQQRLHWALQRRGMREAGWNPLEFGEPLNQEYLLLMWLEYTQLTLHNMARLGARLRRDDADAVCAFWRLALHWLGLDWTTLPAYRDSAGTLLRRLLWRYSHDHVRRQRQLQVLREQLRQINASVSNELLNATWQWCNPDHGMTTLPDRSLRWLITSNRGATLAYYHLPGVDTLRRQWHIRQLRNQPRNDLPTQRVPSRQTA